MLEDRKIIKSQRGINPLPWNKQGYPYYSGDASYYNKIEINSDFRKAVINIDTRDAVEVSINNNQVGKRLWPPYELDITGFIKKGSNEIKLEVTSTYANLMGDKIDNGINRAPQIFLFE